MSSPSKLSQASFRCKHCQKTIYVPIGLPQTTAPCPHCGKEVTSPDQSKGKEEKSSAPAAAPVEQPVRLESGSHSADHKKEMTSQKLPVEKPEKISPPSAAETSDEPITSPVKNRSNVGVVIAAVVILLLACVITLWLAQKWKQDKPSVIGSGSTDGAGSSSAQMAREAWLVSGWKEDASEVLKQFTEAKTSAERMKHVIPNEGVEEELKVYYPEGKDDSDTPSESFGHVHGVENDHERGIFLMQYRQPAQIDMRTFFAPIGSLEKVIGQEETSLLEMAHRIDEDNLSKPIGINAFFKEIDGQLKLDSSVFIQGKFRTFKLFTSYAQPEKSKIFRVVVSESLSYHYRDNSDIRTYRFEDFAYPSDFVVLPVDVNSENGKILSQLNWYGEDRDRIYKTATVELEWTDEKPSQLQIKRVLCWEFLGVGGTLGNTELPVEDEPEPDDAKVE